MRRKLTDQEIYRIHQLAMDGTPVSAIAVQFDVHRNTIGSHLRLSCSYSEQLLKRVRAPLLWDNNTKLRTKASSGLPSTKRISPANAAIYLPGWPSKCRIARLRRAGVIELTSSGWMNESLIRRAARMMMRPGVWFESRNLRTYFGDACYEVLERFEELATHCLYWRSREFFYLPAIPIYAAGYSPKIPSSTLSRISECLRISDVATL